MEFDLSKETANNSDKQAEMSEQNEMVQIFSGRTIDRFISGWNILRIFGSDLYAPEIHAWSMTEPNMLELFQDFDKYLTDFPTFQQWEWKKKSV